ncbi:MAG: oxidoreductase [Rhodospirillaceae bacterium]|nr:oxidoreductase [Rhodospirillaceae bacterium]
MVYRNALITGATSGIGKAFAEALPEATNLVLTGRNEARLKTLGDFLSRDGRQVETVVADLATETGRERVIAAAQTAEIELLINNAGLGQFGAVVDNPPEAEREMTEVNVVAPVVLTRALLPDMIARANETGRRAGVIVVSSVVAFQPMPFFATYAATKAFDLLFAEALAGELNGKSIDVLAVCPGATRTEFFRRAGLSDTIFPHIMDPEVVARRGLAALGRRTIDISDPVRRIILLPALALRAVKRGVIRVVMLRISKRGK